MPNTRTTIQVGDALVTVLNVGDLVLRLKDEMDVPESAWRAEHADIFEQPRLFPSQSVLIQVNGVATLVDVGDYVATVAADSPYFPPGYMPPPGIPAQLALLGLALEDVRQVVITHAHWDHFAGTTMKQEAEYIPTFPNATYFLGERDWTDPDTQAALLDPSSLEGRTLGVLHRHGMLTVVEGNRDVSANLAILATPGESPGHQIVRLRSGTATLYCLGDLFHDGVEVEHLEWMASWADHETMLATRRKLIDAALAEEALLVAAHIAGFGRLQPTATGARWVAA